MKKAIILYAFTLLVVSLCYGQSRQYDHTFEVLDNVVPTEDFRYKDVFVIRTNDMYVVHYYGKQHGKIQHYQAGFGGKHFTHLSYSWLGLRKVAIRLFDENSTNEFEGKVFGFPGGSGVEFETDDFDLPVDKN